MSRKAKGKRPVFMDDPDSDKLLAIVMALAAEVSVLRERLDTAERLAESRGLLLPGEIDSFQPSVEVIGQREAWRADYQRRLLRIVHHEGESVARNETPETYEQAIAAVSP